MIKIIKTILIFCPIFICSCLNFTGSPSSIGNSDKINDKYAGTYEGSITITDSYNITRQGYATITVTSGNVITINISGGYISLLANIYNENIIKISDNSCSASMTSSGDKYDFTFSFSDYAMNINFNRSDNTKGSGNLQKAR